MIFRVIAKVIYMILLGIETLVGIRFVFKLIGANEGNAIVNLVYQFSAVFIAPFRGIIDGDFYIGRFFVDVDALVALVVYMIVAFVVIEVIKVFSGPSPTAV